MEILVFLILGTAGAGSLGALGYHLCRPNAAKTVSNTIYPKELCHDLSEYRIVSEKILEERKQIIEVIRSACENKSVPTDASHQFFKTNANTLKNQQPKTEGEKLSDALHELVNNYPKFNAAEAKANSNYIKNQTRALIEHHAKTIEIAEICLGLMEEADSLYSSTLLS